MGRFGQFLLREGLVAEEVMRRAYAEQAERRHLRIGEILLGLGAITFSDLIQYLDTYRSCSKIGELLVMNGNITGAQLSAALERQPQSGSMLGKILVEMGACEMRDVIEALGVQRRERIDPFGLQQEGLLPGV